jgi:hypothetical protein
MRAVNRSAAHGRAWFSGVSCFRCVLGKNITHSQNNVVVEAVPCANRAAFLRIEADEETFMLLPSALLRKVWHEDVVF